MKTAVKTDLFASAAPLEWAVIANNQLYTAQIPIDVNGKVVGGGIEAQARQTMDNLKHTIEAAKLTMDDERERPFVSQLRRRKGRLQRTVLASHRRSSFSRARFCAFVAIENVHTTAKEKKRRK